MAVTHATPVTRSVAQNFPFWHTDLFLLPYYCECSPPRNSPAPLIRILKAGRTTLRANAGDVAQQVVAAGGAQATRDAPTSRPPNPDYSRRPLRQRPPCGLTAFATKS